MTYLRCTIGRWNTDLSSDEGQEAFRLINDEGLRVFRSQPGFIRYRLMVADPTTTIAVAEWESEELGKPAATGTAAHGYTQEKRYPQASGQTALRVPGGAPPKK